MLENNSAEQGMFQRCEDKFATPMKGDNKLGTV